MRDRLRIIDDVGIAGKAAALPIALSFARAGSFGAWSRIAARCMGSDGARWATACARAGATGIIRPASSQREKS